MGKFEHRSSRLDTIQQLSVFGSCFHLVLNVVYTARIPSLHIRLHCAQQPIVAFVCCLRLRLSKPSNEPSTPLRERLHTAISNFQRSRGLDVGNSWTLGCGQPRILRASIRGNGAEDRGKG